MANLSRRLGKIVINPTRILLTCLAFAFPTGATQRAQRKLLLSIDIDPAKLPGENPLWKAVRHQFSYYPFPSPTLQLTPRFRGISWYR